MPEEKRQRNDNGLNQLETREANIEAPPQRVVLKGGTFESFRYRDYTLFWSGALVSNVGTWMQNYALAIVVYAFRRSETDLGIMNFAMGIPVLFLAIWAGSLADRVDRKQLIIWTQAILLLQAAALGFLYFAGQLSARHPLVALGWVVLLSLVNGVMSALAFPSWQSLMPDLVPRKSLLNAIALNAAQFQSARMVGPMIAGALVLAGASMGDIFYVNAASFIFVIVALWLVRPRVDESQVHHVIEENPWERLTAGIKYAREHTMTGTIVLTVAVLTMFAMPYMILLPAFVDKVLGFSAAGGGADPAVVSYIMTANGLGAAIGALTVASLRDIRRDGLLRYSLAAMAVLLLAFAVSRWLPLTLIIAALAGAAFLTSTSLANTMIQSTVPNRLRGRVMSLFVMSFMGLMPISAAFFGPLGSAIGPARAIFGGALVLLVWVAYLFLRPHLLANGAE